MAKFESTYSVFADSTESSRKRKLACHGVPLPYLIRPRRKLPAFDIFTVYNDYADSESDGEDVPSIEEAVETEKANSFGLENESDASLSEKCDSNSDDEYVIVSDVEVDSKTERKGAIQMLELSKNDGDSEKDESESEDVGSQSEGSNSDGDEWVVV